ncbi:MAG: antibiotic biosynthesis monooxygenase family protein [Cyanobacteria bacterium P01_F01_bin.13]
MITRIFRVKIKPDLRDEFEPKFATISVHAVKSQDGLISVTIGKPTAWTPNEYVMITCWENEESIRNLAGDSWNNVHIPAGMEKFVDECWVHHYRDYIEK